MVLSRAQGYIYKHFIHKIITYSTYGEQFFISNLCWSIKQVNKMSQNLLISKISYGYTIIQL